MPASRDLGDEESIPLIEQGDNLEGTTGDDVNLSDDSPKHRPSHQPYSNFSHDLKLRTAAFFVTLLAFASAMLSVGNYWRSPPSITLDVGNLRRPSLYLGIDRVPSIKVHGLTFGPSTNQHDSMHMGISVSAADQATARTLARVNSFHPNLTFLQDGWVTVTEQDHMIVEFAVPPRSRGSQCRFQASFPARRDLGDTLVTLERDDAVIAAGPTLSFLALDAPSHKVNLTTLTWNSRPSSGGVMGSLIAVHGLSHRTPPFPCPSDGRVLAEVSCEGTHCRVEYDYVDSQRHGLGIELVLL